MGLFQRKGVQKKRTAGFFDKIKAKRKIKKKERILSDLYKVNDVKLIEIENMLGNLKGKSRIETIGSLDKNLIKEAEKIIRINEQKSNKLKNEINLLKKTLEKN